MAMIQEPWLERFKTPLAVLAFVVLGGGFVVLWVERIRHPGFLSQAAADCRHAYQGAESPTDTAIIDARNVAAGVKGDPTTLTCGVLRHRGEL